MRKAKRNKAIEEIYMLELQLSLFDQTCSRSKSRYVSLADYRATFTTEVRVAAEEVYNSAVASYQSEERDGVFVLGDDGDYFPNAVLDSLSIDGVVYLFHLVSRGGIAPSNWSRVQLYGHIHELWARAKGDLIRN